MIRLSNGYEFEYMAASGALGFDGQGWWWEKLLKPFGLFDPTLFTSVIKTLTLKPRTGRGWRRVHSIRGGTVNAVGLINSGFDWWCREVGPVLNSKKVPVIISLLGSPYELALMTRSLSLENFDIVGVEINASCSNVKYGIMSEEEIGETCHWLKKLTSLPLILKISVLHDVGRIIKTVGDTVEAFSINSVPWHIVFPNKKSPLARFGGGAVSGKIAQSYTWDLVKRFANLTDIPVIGPSIWNFEDIEKLRRLGAKAISFGSVFLRYPWRPTLFVRKDK